MHVRFIGTTRLSTSANGKAKKCFDAFDLQCQTDGVGAGTVALVLQVSIRKSAASLWRIKLES